MRRILTRIQKALRSWRTSRSFILSTISRPNMSESIVRGTVVFVPFPFTDLSSEKLRPAVVISSPRLGGVDVCVVFITSRIATSVPPDGLLIDDTHPVFSKTGLKTASPIRAGKIRMGNVDQETIRRNG